MNYGIVIFLGAFVALATSWYSMVLAPQLHIGRQEPVTIEETGQHYPVPRSGLAQQGEEIYRANGCYYCHTRQVRPEGFGSDYERGWGKRRTVAQDYLYDSPVMIGSQRIGPDLANIGERIPDTQWHLVHLYKPRLLVPKSTMPPYPYLFEKRKIGQQPSPDALKLPQGEIEEGYEIIPKNEAKALVAYLLSQRVDVPLFEAPLPVKPEAAKPEPPQAAQTNAAPAATKQ